MASTWPELHAGTNFNYVWDVATLAWVKETQPTGGGGGGGTVDQGTGGSSPWSVDVTRVGGSAVTLGQKTSANSIPVVLPSDQTVPVSGPLTDTQLRATPVPVSGTVATGGLTDTQLRATPVPVSGTVTASGPLTDTQLRATPVPVSGTVATGALTDTQLRATPVPISATNLDVALSTRLAESTFTGRINTQGQKTMALSTPVVLASDQAAIPVTGSFSSGGPTGSTTTKISPAWRQAVQLLAVNASRKEAQIVNQTNAPFFLYEGSTASDLTYTAIIPPRGKYILDVTVAVSAWWNVIPTDGWVVVTERT